ncbi:hypothetical protein [Bifidobacterium aquikefiri]|uniref:hypothetical protein n=1 Tax=Bifidobacterium aquikefiri TaxID=1653207 RepID=UPI0039ECC58D
MRNHDDADDVSMRPAVWAEQHGDSAQERNQRTRTLLEKRKDAIIDALHDPSTPNSERGRLQELHGEVRADIARIRYGASVSVLRELDRKWQ